MSGRSRLPGLKSMLELKEHIQNNHMDLCIETIFVTVRNRPAKQGAPHFSYLLCTLCGKCFSQVPSECQVESNRIYIDSVLWNRIRNYFPKLIRIRNYYLIRLPIQNYVKTSICPYVT